MRKASSSFVSTVTVSRFVFAGVWASVVGASMCWPGWMDSGVDSVEAFEEDDWLHHVELGRKVGMLRMR